MGTPRELKTMQEVLAIAAFALSRHAGAWPMAGWLFGGGVPREPLLRLTRYDSDVGSPSATQPTPPVFSNRSTRYVRAARLTNKRARVKSAAARILASAML